MSVLLNPGTDAVMVLPEWSADLMTWHFSDFVRSARELEVWTATVGADERLFMRVKVTSRR
ncbi:MAG: hypothetical protein ACKVKH_11780 [Verrucomicrobiales bacterium]